MSNRGVVLVHGGAHGAWCWEPTLPHLNGRVLALDLPPKSVRGVPPPASLPPEIATVGVDEFATSALADIDAAGLDRFVLVGHSMGGLTISEIARRVPERVAHLVFVSCIVPAEGQSLVDGLPADIQEMTRAVLAAARAGDVAALGIGLDDSLKRQMFCNDMDETQTRFVLDRCGAEAPSAFDRSVTRGGIPPALPKTYLRLLRDQSLTPDVQDVQIANLRASPGGEVDVIELDTGHDVMVSHPVKLAQALNPIVDRALRV